MLESKLPKYVIFSSLQRRVPNVAWNVQSDEFRFSTAFLPKSRVDNNLLSSMNSFFGPLSLVVPTALEIRLMNRVWCRMKLEWDETMPKNELRKWRRWFANLPIKSL